MTTLRVASYNLRGLRDDNAEAAAVVRAIDPDVLLVQEVPRLLGAKSRTRAFADACGLDWQGRRGGGPFLETTIMTSPRVHASRLRHRSLKVGWRENPRHYVLSRITCADGTRATVVSVHLSLFEHQRVGHIRAILAGVAADPAGPDEEPLIIGGDLNEGEDAAGWGVLAESLVEVSDDRLTFPSRAPRVRIDAIFARGHTAVTPGDQGLLDGRDLVAATDHLPIWVDLELPGPAAT